MYNKILMTLDATPTDRAIIEHVKDLATAMHSRVALLHVADGWAARTYGADAVSPEITEDKAYLEKVRAEFQTAGIPTEAELAYGEPADEIIKWVEKQRLRSGGDEHARTPIHRRLVLGIHVPPRPAHRQSAGPASAGEMTLRPMQNLARHLLPARLVRSASFNVCNECSEGFLADVVLDAFGVGVGDGVWDAERFEKFDDDLVAAA